MNYTDRYQELKASTNYTDDVIDLGGNLVLRNFDFSSQVRFADPAAEAGESLAFPPEAFAGTKYEGLQAFLNTTDAEIEDNLHFRYHMIMPSGHKKARNIIIMFHGFNEKYWDKYLPWAAHLASGTGKAVVMFPIAFHMNRAPALWGDIRSMHQASKARKERYPALLCSSLSNVAISSRLHNKPDRYIWSGLESYHDVIDFVEDIKKGNHPAIEADAGIDFFSYSIGTFLGEVILMTNKNGYFSRSRYASFCGGPVFNRLSPASKLILDSEANVSLYSFLVEHLESHMKTNPHLKRLLSGEFEEGVNFRSLLNYKLNREYREDKFRQLGGRLYAIALANDEVVPPYEVVNTLTGSRMDINIRVDILDFPYSYRHEDPFPSLPALGETVGREFRKTFDRFNEFLM